jgi:DNA repair protein RadC
MEVRYRRGKVERDAARLTAAFLADRTEETVLALHFNTKRRLIGLHVVAIGSLDASAVHPREVFKAALLSNAASLILVHNHVSGEPTPSPEDERLFEQLKHSGDILGVPLADALIVTDPAEGVRYYSVQEHAGR